MRVMVVNLLLGAASPNIDNWAHLGGLAGGALLAFACGPNLVWEGRRLVDRPLLRFA
jgi:membrane associated rhomboid family serine protease